MYFGRISVEYRNEPLLAVLIEKKCDNRKRKSESGCYWKLLQPKYPNYYDVH